MHDLGYKAYFGNGFEEGIYQTKEWTFRIYHSPDKNSNPNLVLRTRRLDGWSINFDYNPNKKGIVEIWETTKGGVIVAELYITTEYAKEKYSLNECVRNYELYYQKII